MKTIERREKKKPIMITNYSMLTSCPQRAAQLEYPNSIRAQAGKGINFESRTKLSQPGLHFLT